MFLNQSLVEQLLKSLKNEDFYIEFQNLENIDIIIHGEDDEYEKFKKTLLENDEKEFLELLIKNELI